MTATIKTPETVLTVPEVRAHLGTKDDGTIYRLVKSGELRAIRVGRLIRIPESSLAEFISGCGNE